LLRSRKTTEPQLSSPPIVHPDYPKLLWLPFVLLSHAPIPFNRPRYLLRRCSKATSPRTATLLDPSYLLIDFPLSFKILLRDFAAFACFPISAAGPSTSYSFPTKWLCWGPPFLLPPLPHSEKKSTFILRPPQTCIPIPSDYDPFHQWFSSRSDSELRYSREGYGHNRGAPRLSPPHSSWFQQTEYGLLPSFLKPFFR